MFPLHWNPPGALFCADQTLRSSKASMGRKHSGRGQSTFGCPSAGRQFSTHPLQSGGNRVSLSDCAQKRSANGCIGISVPTAHDGVNDGFLQIGTCRSCHRALPNAVKKKMSRFPASINQHTPLGGYLSSYFVHSLSE